MNWLSRIVIGWHGGWVIFLVVVDMFSLLLPSHSLFYPPTSLRYHVRLIYNYKQINNSIFQPFPAFFFYFVFLRSRETKKEKLKLKIKKTIEKVNKSILFPFFSPSLDIGLIELGLIAWIKNHKVLEEEEEIESSSGGGVQWQWRRISSALCFCYLWLLFLWPVVKRTWFWMWIPPPTLLPAATLT